MKSTRKFSVWRGPYVLEKAKKSRVTLLVHFTETVDRRRSQRSLSPSVPNDRPHPSHPSPRRRWVLLLLLLLFTTRNRPLCSVITIRRTLYGIIISIKLFCLLTVPARVLRKSLRPNALGHVDSTSDGTRPLFLHVLV